MKVLFTIDSLGNGGTERSLAELLRCFSTDTEVVFCYCYNNETLKPLYEQLPVQLVNLQLKGRYSFIKGIRLLVQLIRRERPDLIVCSLYRASIMSRIASLLTGVKLVDTLVEETYGAQRRSVFKGRQALKFVVPYWLDRLTAGIPSHWISNSKSIALANSKHLRIPMSKITTIYRGRDSSLLRPWSPPSQKEHFCFAAIGRLYPKKGFSDLVQAFAMVASDFPEAQLVIYGGGAFESTLMSMILERKLENRIRLSGNTPDAWNCLYKAHSFVFPSWYEGFSGALVEAMMMGIPIVASDIPMNLEAVTHEKTALVHRVKNVQDLSERLREVLNNYPHMIELGAAARKEALERFELRKIAGEYERVLKGVVEKVSGGSIKKRHAERE